MGIPIFVALFFAPFTAATPEYAVLEKKACLYCHTALGKPDLNEAGKYYKKHRTLEGYKEEKKPEPAPKREYLILPSAGGV